MKDKAFIRYFNVGPYPVWFGVTTSEIKFRKELKRLKIAENLQFVSPNKDAMVHCFEHKNELNMITTVRMNEKYKKSQVIGLLVHEAVHVWQEIMIWIGEKHPGDEISAYSIQNIAQSMIEECMKGE